MEDPESGTYGKYVVEPLERGYGMTLGNAALAEVAKDDLMHAITLTFGIFVIVCAVGIVLSLTGRREKK